MEDFKEKYDELVKRGYTISFYAKDNHNIFTKTNEKIYYAVFRRNGKEILHFPSRISSEQAFLNAYDLIPKVEEFLNRNSSI